MSRQRFSLRAAVISFALSVMFTLSAASPADALIHEIIGAECRFGGELVVPPGQAGASNGNSFVRALQATGVISSIVVTATSVTVNFDLTKPASKYTSAGFDLTIPNGAGPGISLTLAPLPVRDAMFPAFLSCRNLNP